MNTDTPRPAGLNYLSNPTLTVKEAAEVMGIGRNAAYAGVRNGVIPSIRFGRRVVIPTAKLLELLGRRS
jgi:excisionase family DNA binding protein